jgi:hypothetical protein
MNNFGLIVRNIVFSFPGRTETNAALVNAPERRKGAIQISRPAANCVLSVQDREKSVILRLLMAANQC